MCTYHGILQEYPLISIDSFESHNYTSTMFFITHVHMDHLIGLERPEFGRYVAKVNAPIYLSDISKQFLSTMTPYRHLIPYFKSVPLDQPFTLTIQSNDPVQATKKEGAAIESLKTTLCSHTPNMDETIVVTCFGSGHCPGSMMVWIEGEHGNVLFTGDFRLYRGQAKRLEHLHRRRTDDDDDYLFKPIDNLYIDMTFFRPEILHIPTREISCEALILWMKRLISEQSNVNFYFKTSARVGYEQIYRSLFAGLGMRIHVEQGQYDFFACLPIIQECLTIDPTSTRLHACRTASSNFLHPCSLFRNCEKPIRILLSIMWFTEQIAASELLVEYHEYHSNFEQNISKRCLGFQDYHNGSVETSFPDNFLSYRLCYSLHSSFAEVVDVLETLRPKCVTPIAAPPATQISTKRLFRLIDYFIGEKSGRRTPSVVTEKFHEMMQRKSVQPQIQLKHRYESFESRIERKRRRKFVQEQQQRKANDEELDLGMNDEREQHLLRRLHSLHQSSRQPASRYESQNSTSFEEIMITESLSSAGTTLDETGTEVPTVDLLAVVLPTDAQNEPLPMEVISTTDETPLALSPGHDQQRERTSSDASSDTVDYDFDPQIPITLLVETQLSSISSEL